MSLLYLLLLTEIILLTYALKAFKKDLFSPTILSYLCFIISTILNILMIDDWKINFHFQTYLIITLGLLSMLIAELFAKSKYCTKSTIIHKSAMSIIKISNRMQIIVSIIVLILTFLYYKEMINFIIIQQLSNIGDAKELMTTEDLDINPLIKQGYKIIIAEAYIFGFIYINNSLTSNNYTKYIKCLIPVLCGMLISIIGGNRIEILKIISTMFLYYYIVYQIKTSWKNKPNKKIIKTSIPFFLLFIFLFSSLRYITKSGEEEQSKMGDLLKYTAFYGGSPIQVLDIKVNRGIENWRVQEFAGQTMSGIYDFLNKHNLMKTSTMKNHSMVYIGGESNASGNVYTIFGRAYADFSLTGMCIFIFFVYFYFSRFYYLRIYKKSKLNYRGIKHLILYAFFYSTIIVFSFYDTAVYAIFSQTGILQIIVLLVLIKIHLMKYEKTQYNYSNIYDRHM